MTKLGRAVVAALTAAAVALAGSGAAGTAMSGGGHAFAFVLTTPSAGDVSYAVAQVRLAPAAESRLEPRGQRVFAERVGGLALVIRSARWRALRASTRVYLVVSRVAGASADTRDLAVFVVRRRTGAKADRVSGGEITVAIANARAAARSFWVRGVDRRGLADVFRVHDILATATANWTRYLGVLKIAHALAAAMHPRVATSSTRPRPTAPAGGPTVWVGGSRPTRRVRQIFALIRHTLGNPSAFAAAKHSRVVTDFIAHELDNPRLARRWRDVTSRLPLTIPDRYAAAAQEEATFTHVHAPRISPTHVAIDDSVNSSSEAAADVGGWAVTNADLLIDGRGPGMIETLPDAGFRCFFPTHGLPCGYWFFGTVKLLAIPDPGYEATWSGCDVTGFYVAGQPPGSDSCSVDVSGRGDLTDPSNPALSLFISFDPIKVRVTVNRIGSETGTVTSTPGGIDCPPQCSADFAYATAAVLTATPRQGATFAGWAGCEVAAGATCTVGPLVADATVTATFGRAVSISRTAGDGTRCNSRPQCGDGGAAVHARLSAPGGVAVDAAGNLYAAAIGDNEVRRIASDGTITRFAGDGDPCTTAPNCGDGGAATSAQLDGPSAVAVDSAGDVYVADYFDAEVRRIAHDGTISRVAGNGTLCTSAPNCGDGGAAVNARLNGPSGVAVDAAGNLYIADTFDNEIRKVATNGVITTIAGDGTACTTYPRCGDGSPATAAQLNGPSGVALDATGHVYIADTFDNEIRRVESNGTVSRVAGSGTRCTTAPDCGDGDIALRARFNAPTAVAFDASGSLYVADSGDHAIRRIAPDGFVFAFAGNGTACSSPPDCGDGGPAGAAQLASPDGVAADAAGDVYIGDTGDNEIRKAG